jgi:hypothetical protein
VEPNPVVSVEDIVVDTEVADEVTPHISLIPCSHGGRCGRI